MTTLQADPIEVVVIPKSPNPTSHVGSTVDNRGAKRAPRETQTQSQTHTDTIGQPTEYYHEVLINYSHELEVFVRSKAQRWGFMGLNFGDYVKAFQQGVGGERLELCARLKDSLVHKGVFAPNLIPLKNSGWHCMLK